MSLQQQSLNDDKRLDILLSEEIWSRNWAVVLQWAVPDNTHRLTEARNDWFIFYFLIIFHKVVNMNVLYFYLFLYYQLVIHKTLYNIKFYFFKFYLFKSEKDRVEQSSQSLTLGWVWRSARNGRIGGWALSKINGGARQSAFLLHKSLIDIVFKDISTTPENTF